MHTTEHIHVQMYTYKAVSVCVCASLHTHMLFIYHEINYSTDWPNHASMQ